MRFFCGYLFIGAMWSFLNYYIMSKASFYDPLFDKKVEQQFKRNPFFKWVFYTLPLSWPIHVVYFMRQHLK